MNRLRMPLAGFFSAFKVFLKDLPSVSCVQSPSSLVLPGWLSDSMRHKLSGNL